MDACSSPSYDALGWLGPLTKAAAPVRQLPGANLFPGAARGAQHL